MNFCKPESAIDNQVYSLANPTASVESAERPATNGKKDRSRLQLRRTVHFASKNVNTYIRTIWPPTENRADIDDKFVLRDIIKAFNRSADYLILYLEQARAHRYEALNGRFEHEVRDHGFPFPANPYYSTDRLKASDPQQIDTYIREYFNIIDKAVNKVCAGTNLPVIVATTRENFDLLKQVADKPSIYTGHFSTNHHQDQLQQLAAEAWELVKQNQHSKRAAAIDEMMQAVNAGKVVPICRRSGAPPVMQERRE